MLRLLACLVLAASPALAQEFRIPEDFHRGALVLGLSAGETGIAEITPDRGLFRDLTTLAVSRLDYAIDDPEAWLRLRLLGETGEVAEAALLLVDPDSPFSDPSFDDVRASPERLGNFVETIAHRPDQLCQPSSTNDHAEYSATDLYCVFEFGRFRSYLRLRLVRTERDWYFLRTRSMNLARDHQLRAIADSFHLTETLLP